MLAWRNCFSSARRLLHSKCLRLAPARDPAFLSLFEPQPEKDAPSPEQSASGDVDDLTKGRHLRNAFCHKIRHWARTTPPEYISKPPPRPRFDRSKRRADHARKGVAEKVDAHDNDDDDDDGDDETKSDHSVDADDGELDVVDDEDELEKLDHEDEASVSKNDFAGHHGFRSVDGPHNEVADEERAGGNAHKVTSDEEAEARRRLLPCDPQNDGSGDADEQLYYYTAKGKLKYKPIHIIAPKEEIYQRLSQSGLISARLKRPLPVQKLVKKMDADIVGWYYYCSIELLQFFRICHNLKEVKAIVEYHIRWSAIRTLAKKYNCNPREVVKKYGRDLECEDKKGKKVRLMTRQEIKDVSRGVNKRVEMIHRFKALNVLDEMD